MEHKNYKWGFHSFFRFLLIITILFFSNSTLQAQARDSSETSSPKPKKKKGEGFDPSKLIFGGSLGASFGNVTYIEISPRVGYMLKPSWLVGIAAKYSYYEEKTFYGNYSTNMYGGGAYTQYYFLKYFVAHAEYELLNLEDFRPPFERVNIHSIFVGGGLSSRMGNNSFFNVLLLYNLNETYNSPYANPYLQIGFGVGL